ncbi:gas vesicle protein GvpO [Nonomuraea montanisoli]|uniref:gas vesicle protein GvpO n=1 Tax=Nonomuraea montanisoli TaxID=2741721 RepID=UPI002E2B5FFB|nr:gas vesicle protein GvpO [Nonomuraea montanisoli]
MPARRRSRAGDVSERERDDLPPDEDAVDDEDERPAENDEDYEDEPSGEDDEDDDYQDEENEEDEEGDGGYDDDYEAEDDYVEERPRRRGRRLSAATAGEAGLRHIAELTSREPEGVTLVKPSDGGGGGWTVGVEVVEDRRIPSSGDILALYEAELDPEGGLLSYRRLRRYRRGSGDSERG